MIQAAIDDLQQNLVDPERLEAGVSRLSRLGFEVLVPGRYRWLPLSGPQPVAIDGTLLAPGASVDLDRGDYRAHFVEDVPGGMLVLAVDEPPGAAPLEFYH